MSRCGSYRIAEAIGSRGPRLSSARCDDEQAPEEDFTDSAALGTVYLDALDRLNAAKDTLEVIAEWRVDLTARIRRAQLIFLFHDCETDIQPLIEEVAAFKRVCACLAWR